jgi:hypothetical protein
VGRTPKRSGRAPTLRAVDCEGPGGATECCGSTVAPIKTELRFRIFGKFSDKTGDRLYMCKLFPWISDSDAFTEA